MNSHESNRLGSLPPHIESRESLKQEYTISQYQCPVVYGEEEAGDEPYNLGVYDIVVGSDHFDFIFSSVKEATKFEHLVARANGDVIWLDKPKYRELKKIFTELQRHVGTPSKIKGPEYTGESVNNVIICDNSNGSMFHSLIAALLKVQLLPKDKFTEPNDEKLKNNPLAWIKLE